MIITIAKSVIENILLHAGPFLEKKDTSQITSHIYLNASNSLLTVKATDYEIGFLVSTKEVNITQDGNITANGKKFLDIVRILKDGNINLEVKGDTLHITQGHSNFGLFVSIHGVIFLSDSIKECELILMRGLPS